MCVCVCVRYIVVNIYIYIILPSRVYLIIVASRNSLSNCEHVPSFQKLEQLIRGCSGSQQ